MKKLLALLLCLSLVCSLAACGRKPIGVLKGEIGEILEIDGTEYRLTFDSGVTVADKGDYLGNATDGKKGFAHRRGSQPCRAVTYSKSRQLQLLRLLHEVLIK